VTASAGARYWQLTVPVEDALAEGVANFLWEAGAVGVVEEQAPDARVRVRAFFPAGVDGGLLAGVHEYLDGLRQLGLGAGGPATLAPLPDDDWGRAWRAHFRPLPVGRGLLVAPPWDVPDAPGRLVLVIEPGRAFGTGHHGTTAGCLARLEARLAAGAPAAALDLGTGSGILAVAAARLGVAAVLAVDDDPDAVAAAEANAARNGVADRVRCRCADVRALDAPAAPLVLANLLTAAHHGLASRYAALVAPGGTLVVGGVLDPEVTDVAATLARHGFTARATLSLDGWTTLELERTGPRAALHGRG
jgi:ribosomal protein L11 methyltransferase